MSYPLRPGQPAGQPKKTTGQASLAALSRHPDLQAQYKQAMKKAGCCNRGEVERSFLSRLRARS